MGFGVKQKTVFDAFRAKKISFAYKPDSKHLYEVVAPNGQAWTEYIPPELDRRTPQRLSELYDIPLQWLYNPLMIPGDEDKKPPS